MIQLYCKTTSSSLATLTYFMSIEDITNTSIEDSVAFLIEKIKNKFCNPETAAKLLQSATIATSLNCIKSPEKEVKGLDKAIEKAVKLIDNHHFQCLLSTLGIGPVFTAEILAELSDIDKFNNQASVTKYAG